jgi:hypothetical protein
MFRIENEDRFFRRLVMLGGNSNQEPGLQVQTLRLHSFRRTPLPGTRRLLLLPCRTRTTIMCLAAIAFSWGAIGSGIASTLPRDPSAAQAPGPASKMSSAQTRQACTLYVGPNGAANNSGTTPTSPITLLQSAALATAGDVVCIEPGTYSLSRTFYPSHSGNPNAWIVFTNYGGGVVNILWAGGPNASDQNMFHLYSATFPDGPSYIEFHGLTLNGQNSASNGFFCQGSHHVRYVGNTVINQGSAGIGSVLCDYQTADHNIVYHNGYNDGRSSGISQNSNQWLDGYYGFHNIVSNNIVIGEFDSSSYHMDGNGIIMDLSARSYDPSTSNTPPALIVNNVVYGNGGRCIQTYVVSNIWVVNNTCYDNGLDLSLGGVSSILSYNANNGYVVNNVVQTWGNMPPFTVQGTINYNLIFSHNLIFGGINSGFRETGFTDTPSMDFIIANPLFVSPPYFNPTQGGQYATALDPSLMGNDLHLQLSSPGIGAGIDPSSLTSNSALIWDMRSYIYSDITGNPRPQGGPFDLGAYQH